MGSVPLSPVRLSVTPIALLRQGLGLRQLPGRLLSPPNLGPFLCPKCLPKCVRCAVLLLPPLPLCIVQPREMTPCPLPTVPKCVTLPTTPRNLGLPVTCVPRLPSSLGLKVAKLFDPIQAVVLTSLYGSVPLLNPLFALALLPFAGTTTLGAMFPCRASLLPM